MTARMSRARALPADSGEEVASLSLPMLYRGARRMKFCSELAMGELSHRELAKKYDITVPEVAQFAKDFETEIAEISIALSGKLAIESAGLWIAKKQNRLAELQDDVEAINYRLTGCHDQKMLGTLLRAKHSALRSAADELAPRAGRTEAAIGGDVVHYVLEADEATLRALT